MQQQSLELGSILWGQTWHALQKPTGKCYPFLRVLVGLPACLFWRNYFAIKKVLLTWGYFEESIRWGMYNLVPRHLWIQAKWSQPTLLKSKEHLGLLELMSDNTGNGVKFQSQTSSKYIVSTCLCKMHARGTSLEWRIITLSRCVVWNSTLTGYPRFYLKSHRANSNWL